MWQAVKGTEHAQAQSAASESHMEIIVVVVELFLTVFLGLAVEEVEHVRGLLGIQPQVVGAHTPDCGAKILSVRGPCSANACWILALIRTSYVFEVSHIFVITNCLIRT